MSENDKPWTSIVEEHLTNEQRQTLSLHRIEALLTEIRDALANACIVIDANITQQITKTPGQIVNVPAKKFKR